MKIRTIAFGLALSYFSTAFGAPGQDQRMTAEEFEATLKYKNGAIQLPGDKANLNIPSTFRYLDPSDSKRILENAWGNPPGEDTLGMLFPSDVSPLSENGWGVIITYVQDGHVSDEDADKIDYNEMLAQIQEAAASNNAERRKQGYEDLHIIGWAQPPYYDKAARKLHWAKDLQFGASEKHTLNYNIRILGREGVLVLNAVADMNQLPMIKDRMKDVIEFANFTAGNTYAEFNSSTDNIATYGLAALVGGAVAAKTGLIAKLIALLIAGKKVILAVSIGIGIFFRKFLGRKKQVSTDIKP